MAWLSVAAIYARPTRRPATNQHRQSHRPRFPLPRDDMMALIQIKAPLREALPSCGLDVPLTQRHFGWLVFDDIRC